MATQQWVAIRRFVLLLADLPVHPRGAEERTHVPPPPRRRSDQPRRGATPDRGGDRGGQRPARSGSPRPARSETGGDRPVRPRFVEPALPEDIDPRQLDRGVRAGLRSLPEDLADKIARHLVAAGRLIDEDPVGASAHAQYARNLAPRLAVVREAAGVAAYRNGEYAAALSELRAVRRMTGDPTYLPIMADCERGLGRPERALALAADADVRRLAPAERVELAIVASGARRDRGEAKAAVVALQGPDLDRSEVAPWTVRLWYAYAAALADADRIDEARQWFESVITIDEDEETDAVERVAELDEV
jgi:tetratricopeptide (TPR) repeat protein